MAILDMSGVSPRVAIRQFSDPVAWAELELLLGLGGGDAEARAGWNADDWADHDFQIFSTLPDARRLRTMFIDAWDRWERLRLAFEKRLQSGELVATGYVKPLKLTDSCTTIPADKWRFLELDFRNGAASGEGLEIVSILIDRADQESGGSDDVAASPYQTGLPGKPTIKHLIIQEILYRVESKNCKLTLKAEAQALHEWAKEKHPEAPTPTARTIENHIRADYRRLAR